MPISIANEPIKNGKTVVYLDISKLTPEEIARLIDAASQMKEVVSVTKVDTATLAPDDPFLTALANSKQIKN